MRLHPGASRILAHATFFLLSALLVLAAPDLVGWGDALAPRTRAGDVVDPEIEVRGEVGWRKGLFELNASNSLVHQGGIEAPGGLRLRLERGRGAGQLRVEFAAGAATRYACVLHADPEQGGVFAGDERLLGPFRFDSMRDPGGTGKRALRFRQLVVEVSEDGVVRASVDGRPAGSAPAPLPIERGILEIEAPRDPHYSGFHFASATLGDGRQELRVAAGFAPLIDLRFGPCGSWQRPTQWLVALALLAVWAALLESALDRVAGARRDRRRALRFLLLPTFWALLYAFAELLALPRNMALVHGAVIGVAHLLRAVDLTFARGARSLGGPAAALGGGLALAAATLWLMAQGSSSVWYEPAIPTTTSPWWTPALALVACAGLLGSRSYPLGTFAFFAPQGLHWLWLTRLHPDPNATIFLAVALLPWIAFSALRIAARPRRPRLLMLLVALVPMAVALVAFELCLRQPFKRFEELEYDAFAVAKSWRIREHTNLLGSWDGVPSAQLRGRCHPLEPDPEVPRIVCLGSSSTAASGLPPASPDAYPAQLEARLRARLGREVEVLNGGIPGAGLYMIRVYLEEVLLRFRPDLVVLYFGANRELPENRLFYWRMRELLQRHPWIESGEELAAAMELRFLSPSLLHAYMAGLRWRVVYGLRLLVNAALDRGQQGRGDPRARAAVEAFLGGDRAKPHKSADEIAEHCLLAGVPLVLVPEITWSSQTGSGDGHDYRPIFLRVADSHGPEVETLWPIGLFPRDALERCMNDEVHLSPRGYGLLAEWLADELIAGGWIELQPIREPQAQLP